MKQKATKQKRPEIPLFKTSLLIIFFFCWVPQLSFSQTSKKTILYSGYDWTYSKVIKGNYYQSGSNYIGRDNSDSTIYRHGMQFTVNGIEANATITNCHMMFSIGSTIGVTDGTIKITESSTDFLFCATAEAAYNKIYTGVALGSINIYGAYSYDINLSLLVPSIQSALSTSPHIIWLGAYNGGESTYYGTTFQYSPNLEVSYTIPTPPAVTNLHFTEKNSTSLVLTWTASTGNVTGYKVYLNNSPTPYVTTSSTTATFTDLCPNTMYTAKVVPYNSYGDGEIASTSEYTKACFISGPGITCNTSNLTFTINNLPTVNSVVWSASPSSRATVTSGTGSTFVTAWRGGFRNGEIVITANVTLSGGCSFVLTSPVWAGNPAVPTGLYLMPEEGVCRGPQQYYNVGVNYYDDSNITGWYWDLQPPGIIIGSKTGSGVNFYYPSSTTPGTYSIAVKAINACGESPYYIEYFTVSDCSEGGLLSLKKYSTSGDSLNHNESDCQRQDLLTFKLFPNPASEQTKIEIVSSIPEALNLNTEIKIRFYDFTNSLVKQESFTGNLSTTINVSDLPSGTYFVKIIVEDKIYDINSLKSLGIMTKSLPITFWQRIVVNHKK